MNVLADPDPVTQPAQGSVAVLEVHALQKHFGGVVVIDDVSWTLADGEALGVIGPNGAGKTTMFNMVAGDLHPDHGRIGFEGSDITALRSDQICRLGVGRTSQIPRPFIGMSVFENVLVATVFGAERPISERQAMRPALNALERTGLEKRANDPAGSLSLLDRKRLELARALAPQPRLLLLDEIAGGLTEAEMYALIETIKAINAEGVAIVWIEHIVHALLAVVDRIITISSGRKIADGEPQQVLDSREVQEVYLGSVAS